MDWETEMHLPPMSHAEAQDWLEFMMQLNGKEGTFCMAPENVTFLERWNLSETLKAMQNNVTQLKPKAKIRKPFTIEAKKDEADLFLYEDIGDSWDGTTAKLFADELKAVADVRTLNIYINSPGGSVFDGVAIFNQLRRHKARKNVVIDGLAASIASVVAMVGDTITIASNGFMMIHNPWALAMGEAADFRKMADQLDKVRGSILDTYAERTGTAPNVISDMMDDETWMTAEEAVEMGFADSIGSEAKMAAKFDLSKFSRVPKLLAEQVDVNKSPPRLALVGGVDLAAADGGVGIGVVGEHLTDEQKSEICAVIEGWLGSKKEPPPADENRARLEEAKRRHKEAGYL